MVLATLGPFTNIGPIATDGTYVVWAQLGGADAGGGVYSVLTTGINQTPVTVASTPGIDGVTAVAVSSGNVYWTYTNSTNNGVAGGTANMAGSGQGYANLQLAVPNAMAVTPDGTKVVWLGQQPSGTIDVGYCTVGTFNCHLSGTDNNANPPLGITADNTYVYYSDTTLIRTMQIVSGTPTTFASGASQAGLMAYSNGFVYWTDYNLDNFSREATPSGTVTQIFNNSSAMAPGVGIAADSKYMYFTQANGFSVLYLKNDGSTMPVLLCRAMQYANAIAIDTKALYFTDGGQKTINKVALPP
jgi:hypothetical protein